MNPVGMLAIGFGCAAIACLAALFYITAGESVTWGRVRSRLRRKRRLQEVVLPRAYLVGPDAGEVVRLAEVIRSRRIR